MLLITIWLATVAISIMASIVFCFYAAIRLSITWLFAVAIWLIFSLAFTFVVTLFVGGVRKK